MFPARPIDLPAALAALADRMRAAAVRAAAWCADVRARAEQRRALAALDDRLLKDVGIPPSDAAREIAKPCWRA